MFDYRHTKQELPELLQAHRPARNVGEAYSLNAVILMARGRTVADLADAMLIDPDAMRDYFKLFKRGGLDEQFLQNLFGSEALLDQEQLPELDAHSCMTVYSTAAALALSVSTTFGIHFTVSDMTAKQRRMGDTYKKAKLVPRQGGCRASGSPCRRLPPTQENKD